MAGQFHVSDAAIPDVSSTADPLHGLVPAMSEHNVCIVDIDGVVTSWKSSTDAADDDGASAFVGQPFSRLFTAEDQARRKPDQLLTLARARGGFEEESWRVRRDGSRYWASVVVEPMHDKQRNIIGFATMTRDISELRALRDALRRSEQRLSLVMNSIAHYAVFVLDMDGVVASWNTAAERTLGYAKQDIIGQHFSCLFSAGDQAAGIPAGMLSAARARGQFEDEGWRIRRDGTRFQARIVVDPIHDEHGEITGFAHVIRDITQQRTIDDLEQRLFQAQGRANRPADDVTDEVAHDFNDLLSAVTVSLDLITRTDDIGRMHSLTLAAQRSAQAGARLTARLLAATPRRTAWPQPQPDDAGMPALPPHPELRPDDDSTRKTVLVVEDDPDVLEIATCAIRELGYNVRRAGDAHAALAILENEPEIGLLFTDIVMPSSLDGLGLARLARELNPAVRILLTSGYPRERLESRHELDERMVFIPKPYKVSVLDAELRELFGAASVPPDPLACCR
nr:PAS domain-containing protein [uncultured Lichenicoccus sp.]